MKNAKRTTDVAIIGAGPVGLFAIFEAGLLKMNCHIIDVLDFVGGQCNALYPEKPIYDIPAHPKIAAEKLISQLKKQASIFKPVYHLSTRVEQLTENSDGTITVYTSTGIEVTAKAVVIAAGVGGFGPNRPPIDNIEEYEGKSVFYMVDKIDKFKNKNIVIAGGGDSAIDWAINLAPVASSISIIHRRDSFRAAPNSMEKLYNMGNKVSFFTSCQLYGLEGSSGKLQNVIVENFKTSEKQSIKADTLLPFFGLKINLGPIENWGLEFDKKSVIVDQTTMKTNRKNIFAIGDIATYPNKLKLILSGFHEAAVAMHSIYNIVYPNTPLHFEYSTSLNLIA